MKYLKDAWGEGWLKWIMGVLAAFIIMFTGWASATIQRNSELSFSNKKDLSTVCVRVTNIEGRNKVKDSMWYLSDKRDMLLMYYLRAIAKQLNVDPPPDELIN